MASTASTSNRKGSSGRVFGRLFKKKKHVPLSTQDTCCSTTDDENDSPSNQKLNPYRNSNGNNNNNRSNSSSNKHKNNMGSAEKENNKYSISNSSSSKNHDSLKPLRKLALEEQQVQLEKDNNHAIGNILSPPSNSNIGRNTKDVNDTGKNVSQMLSDTDFDDIEAFHTEDGCNPFQKRSWGNLVGGGGEQQQKNNKPPKKSLVKKTKGKNKKEKRRKGNGKDVNEDTFETPKFTNKSLAANAKNNTTGTSDTMVLTRSALSRPFGRTSLPSHLAKIWYVEVSPYYDNSYKCWKYQILVQREDYSTNNNSNFLSPVRGNGVSGENSNNANGKGVESNNTTNGTSNTNSPNNVTPIDYSGEDVAMHKSFTAANVTRTLKDIVWLERALRDEYHGALIFPALSMTLTSGTDWTTAVTLDKETFERGEWDPFTLSNELLDVVLEEEGFYDLDEAEDDEKRPPFDPKLISDWLNDILNGVRGKGELILSYSALRMVDVMHSESMEQFFYGRTNEPLVDLHFMKKEKRGSGWLPISLDLQTLSLKDRRDNMDDDKCTIKGLMTFPLLCLNNLNTCNSIDEFGETDSIIYRRDKNRSKQQSPNFWQNSILSDMLKVQSYYIGLQRENTLRAMYRLRILLETEALLSAAWKRFAISLSNLFTAGKDIESCKVGDAKGKKNGTKISKEKVDECLRILARQKVDRATPSLKVLSSMLSAYYADFSAVNPSLSAFSDGLKQLEREKEAAAASSDENWKQALKAVSPLTLFQDPDSVKDTRTLEMEVRVYEQRQNFNESLMKASLLQLCNSIDIRVSRMSWKFFKMESGQASLLSNAAEQVCENLANEIQEENDLEETHGEEELELIKRMLDLGLKQTYKFTPRPRSSSSSHNGSESDLISENDSSLDESVNDHNSACNGVVDGILDHAKERSGRWDSKLAISILKVIGVEKPRICVENSSREVRTVQRLVESLRAQIDRCSDAISMLTELDYGHESNRVTDHRQNFLSDLAVVFSGATYSKNNSPPPKYDFERTLSEIGVNYHDTAGWLTLIEEEDEDFNCDSTKCDGTCGDVAAKYQDIRENGTVEFIKYMNDMLDDQRDRIEKMESFVYMNCVAIEMEKHFSNVRSSALAAWEKKTDITTAITIANKKKLKLLVNELKSKLSTLRPVVSHTSVKEAKERHLGSKALKTELETLASQNFYKLKQTSTHGVVKSVLSWAEYEKNVAAEEIKALSVAIQEIERSLRSNEEIIQADGGAHLFASSGVG